MVQRGLFLVFILTLSLTLIASPVKSFLSRQDSINPSSLTGDYDFQANTGNFHGVVSSIPAFRDSTPFLANVLGDASGPKRIEVDLTNQKVYAFEGDQKVYEFTVSTGKWYPTPTGTFTIWGKFRYTKMSGGNPALNTYYYLPNVPFVMFFSNSQVPASRGFSLHGTYWHNNFGHPMSHGCVNMRTEDAEKLFYWSDPSISTAKTARTDKNNPGTPVIIYGVAPKS